MRWISVVAAVVVIATMSSAVACLNDSELPDNEREFRSQYLDQNLMTSRTLRDQQQPGSGLHNPQDQVMSAAGFALLLGAIGLTLLGRRPVKGGTGSDGSTP